MKITILSLLVACLLNSALSSEQVHDKLSDHQFQKIFRRERRDVPEYEFVNIKSKTPHRSKRELRPVEFEVDNKKVQLNLHPSENVVMSNDIPIWHARTEQGRQHKYEPVDAEEKKIDGVFYEDPETMATLLAYYKDQYIHYDGIFGESREAKVVKAVPEEWRDSTSNSDAGNHFVFNVSSSGKTIALEAHEVDSVSEKLDKPLDTFYPKLLIVVDYSLFEVLNKDVRETVKYVATFWNAVNLKYSKIEKPKIQISVTGLIIAEDLTALDCIYRARNQSNIEHVNPNQLLLDCGSYFHDEFYKNTKFENYDAIITMAKLTSRGILGVAFVAQICDSKYNIGYASDDGNFGGVLTATHELGHLLSLPHDGDNGCEGYIDDKSTVMAPGAVGVKEYLWSDCSIKQLQKFAWSKRSSCMEKYYRHRH